MIKRQFGHLKNRFRGLAKNTAHLAMLFALSNLCMGRKKLMCMGYALINRGGLTSPPTKTSIK